MKYAKLLCFFELTFKLAWSWVSSNFHKAVRWYFYLLILWFYSNKHWIKIILKKISNANTKTLFPATLKFVWAFWFKSIPNYGLVKKYCKRRYQQDCQFLENPLEKCHYLWQLWKTDLMESSPFALLENFWVKGFHLLKLSLTIIPPNTLKVPRNLFSLRDNIPALP